MGAERLLAQDRAAGEAAYVELGNAYAADEAPGRDVAELSKWAHGVDVELEERPPRVTPEAERRASRNWGARSLRRPPRPDPEPPFPRTSALGGLLRAARADGRWREVRDDERLVQALGYRLVELAQNDERGAAARLLRTWVRARTPWRDTEAILWLADGLERHGERELASAALVYAWVHGTQRWWQRTGGGECGELVARALELDTEMAGRRSRRACAARVRRPGRCWDHEGHHWALRGSPGEANAAAAVGTRPPRSSSGAYRASVARTRVFRTASRRGSGAESRRSPCAAFGCARCPPLLRGFACRGRRVPAAGARCARVARGLLCAP